jgi:nitrate reductase gamma subunit
MVKQVVFIIALVLTLAAFAVTTRRFIRFFKLTKPAFKVRQFSQRTVLMLKVAFGQTKIFRKPLTGLLHALVFWGFCVILIGSIEMVIDGLTGTEKVLRFLGVFYDIIMASGDVFALVIALAIIVFLARRIFLKVKRFSGIEMKHISHVDANIALTMILLLMASLLGMNTYYILTTAEAGTQIYGYFPVSMTLAAFISTAPHTSHILFEASWWAHILLIFIFANYLPYSKHFHVFMSVPNVFLSRVERSGKLERMENIRSQDHDGS